MDVDREIGQRMPALERAAGRIVARFGLRCQDRDEILSAGLLKLAQRLRGHRPGDLPFFAGPLPIGAWIHRVATIQMRSEAAKICGQRVREACVCDASGAADERCGEPCDEAADRDARRKLLTAVEALGDEQKSVVADVYLAELGTRRAFRKSGVRWQTFRARHDAGLARLREAFAGDV